MNKHDIISELTSFKAQKFYLLSYELIKKQSIYVSFAYPMILYINMSLNIYFHELKSRYQSSQDFTKNLKTLQATSNELLKKFKELKSLLTIWSTKEVLLIKQKHFWLNMAICHFGLNEYTLAKQALLNWCKYYLLEKNLDKLLLIKVFYGQL